MSERQYHLHDGQKGAAIAIRVISRASKNEIVEIQSDGTVKVRLVAHPAEDEKANKALVAFLAEVLGISVSKLDIVAGANGRDKLISIIDLDAETVHQRILNHIA